MILVTKSGLSPGQEASFHLPLLSGHQRPDLLARCSHYPIPEA